jgi:hypothetical protein
VWIDFRISFWKIVILYEIYRENWKRTNSFVHCLYIPLSSSLMKYLTLPFPSSTLLALDRKVNYSQMYTPNLPTPINTFCLAAVILLMWLRAYHTVKFLESDEFTPLTNLWKNDWVNLNIIWKEGVINKVLSKKVLAKLITYPGAAYLSTKKNRNVKEPLVSSHTISVWETGSTPFVSIGHASKKIQNCPKSFLTLPWLPSNNQAVWETCWCEQKCLSLTQQ